MDAAKPAVQSLGTIQIPLREIPVLQMPMKFRSPQKESRVARLLLKLFGKRLDLPANILVPHEGRGAHAYKER